jgi:hypothetical protein
MTFDVAANLTKMDKDELYALQSLLEAEIARGEYDAARGQVLRDHLARVDDEVLVRAFA